MWYSDPFTIVPIVFGIFMLFCFFGACVSILKGWQWSARIFVAIAAAFGGAGISLFTLKWIILYPEVIDQWLKRLTTILSIQ